MSVNTQSLLAALASLQAEPDPKRAAVLDAARSALMDFGMRRTSMGEIAKRAGVSPATLYRWFDGKDDLVIQVISREAQVALTTLSEVDTTLEPVDQLTEFGVRLIARIRNRPLLDRLLAVDPELILPLMTTNAAPLLRLGSSFLAFRLEAWVSEGRIAPLDSRATAEILARSVHSFVLTPETSLPLQDEAALRVLVRDLLSRLLRSP